MSRQRLYAAAVVLLGAALIPVIAHDGHDHAPPGGRDVRSQRRASWRSRPPRVIGLEIAEVDFGAVEVVRLGGSSAARPRATGRERAGGMVSAVHVHWPTRSGLASR